MRPESVKILLSVWIFFLIGSARANASEDKAIVVRATLYERGTHRNPPLFRYRRTETSLPDGTTKTEAVFTGMDGAPAYSETSESKNGSVISYTWTHHQMNESGKVEVKNGKTFYSHTSGGKTETDSAEAPSNLVIGPTMLSYLKQHWNELPNGIPVRIGVPDRMNDYGFKFVEVEDPDIPADQTHVQLEPTSFFVSLAVKPIHFYYSKDGSRLYRTEGMSLLKVKKNGKWDDLVAETVFE